MNGKYRGLVVHKLKPSRTGAMSSWKRQGRTGEILGTDVQGELRTQAADVGVALLPKSAAARWHFGMVSSPVLSVGFLELPLHAEASLLKSRDNEFARKEWPVR